MKTASNPFLQQKIFFNLHYSLIREIPVLKIGEGQLPLICQHIKVGTEVILKQFLRDGKSIVSVYFQGFKIGELPVDVSDKILSEVQGGKIYRAVVTRLTKRRFLPPSQVFVNILTPVETVSSLTCP
ncbi:MAG: hypothetical protein ACPF8V_09955 [Luteibaculum sp.]